MTENKVTIDMENLTEDERKQLMALCEKANKKEEWPKIGDEYWGISIDGGAYFYNWINNRFNAVHKAFGNVFRTKEEAEFHIEYLKVCAELDRLSDWEEGYLIYCVKYDQYNDMDDIHSGIKVCDGEDLISGPYNFASEASAQNAIDTIGEDRLKKYYFRVKE